MMNELRVVLSLLKHLKLGEQDVLRSVLELHVDMVLAFCIFGELEGDDILGSIEVFRE